jgi:cell division protein ZapA (FtsZ GTPase activity inhibitor)
MVNSIKVNIAGREYSLIGDDEILIKNAANEVNQLFKELKKQNEDEPSSTISILAALNIAEKYYKNRRQFDTDRDYIIKEVSKMAEFLKSNLKN